MPILGTWAEMGMYEVGPAKNRVCFPVHIYQAIPTLSYQSHPQLVDAVSEWPDSEEPQHSVVFLC
jgi:hypothetical protein